MVDEIEWWTGTRARVFVSCGQANDSEKAAAREIGFTLDGLGFCPYVALETHSSKGLTTNIYNHLATAEYFLFVDFRREDVGPGKLGHHRGSLFSHQELGIASFIESDLLPFIQEDVRLEGLMSAMQGNPIPFREPSELPELVRANVTGQRWDRGNRRELRIDTSPPIVDQAVLPGIFRIITPGIYQYYHFRLRNLHRRVMATNCIIQIVACRGPSFADGHAVDVVEMKFKHITLPEVSLPSGSAREFDGALVRMDPDKPPLALPGIVHPTYIDSERIYVQYALTEPGVHEFDLKISSREFGSGLQTLKIELGRSWRETRVEIGPKHRPREESGE